MIATLPYRMLRPALLGLAERNGRGHRPPRLGLLQGPCRAAKFAVGDP